MTVADSQTDGAAGSNLPEFTVSELSERLKRTVEDQFGHVRVRAEISGLKRAASGHIYLTLKDDRAVLDGVIWRGSVARLGCRPEDGLEVVCTGRLTTYPARSRYQLVVERMEPAGVGALMALLEERRRKLMAEGLFEEARKRPIPFLPEVIGVVTSPTGAVIRDILHRLADRFPRRVLLWPVLVQGDNAAGQIGAAIAGFNALPEGGAIPRPDVLIVARGGGSLEDLWAFNEEVVVRAAAASEIPLISAIGHETDTTLIDFAADRRAPTPTAAAEIAVPVLAELVAQTMDLDRRLFAAAQRLMVGRVNLVAGLARGLRNPKSVIEGHMRRLDDLADSLGRSLALGLERRRGSLREIAAALRPAVLRRRRDDLARALTAAYDGLRRDWTRRQRELPERLAALGRVLQSLSHRSVIESHMRRLGDLTDGLDRSFALGLERRRGRLREVAAALRPTVPRRRQQDLARALATAYDGLRRDWARRRPELHERVEALGRVLESLSYRNVLERGFAVLRGPAGAPLTAAAQLSAGLSVVIELHDGHADATIAADAAITEGARAAAPPLKPKAGKPKSRHKDDTQGNLF